MASLHDFKHNRRWYVDELPVRGCDIEQISTVGGNRRAEIFDADADRPVFAAFGVFGLKRSEAILTRNGLHDNHGFICSFHTGKFFLLMMTS